jgi:hypothetical protein
MAMRKRYDVVAVTGKYQSADGTEKSRYVTCGACFAGDDGRLSIKLESVPVCPEWTGWLNLYEPRQAQTGPARDASAFAPPARPREEPEPLRGGAAPIDVGDNLQF